MIITLPGSPKGAKENLESILNLLPHACEQATGFDSRSLHSGGIKKLEEDAGLHRPVQHSQHYHDHTHGYSQCGHIIPKAHTIPEEHLKSNNPQAGPTHRNRTSPYPMIAVEDAIRIIHAQTPPPKATPALVRSLKVGQIVAEDIRSQEAVPAYRASIVDGYAMIVPDHGPSPKGTFKVVSVSHASAGQVPSLLPGQLARITTGAPLPPGATSIVMVEDTKLKSMTPDGQEESEVEILTDAIKPNENVREIGSDIGAGEIVLNKGEAITAVGGELGLLASIGKAEVMVYQKPVVGVLSTGNELIEHDRPGHPRLGEVRDSNRPTIMAALRDWGFPVKDLGIARDR